MFFNFIALDFMFIFYVVQNNLNFNFLILVVFLFIVGFNFWFLLFKFVIDCLVCLSACLFIFLIRDCLLLVIFYLLVVLHNKNAKV